MATPGGIAAAVHAARMGMNVALVERTDHVGGLPANGLGATDIHTKELSGGFFKEFTDSVYNYYVHKYGADSKQVKDCSKGFHFEPSVAEAVFEDMIRKERKISLFRSFQFDVHPENIENPSKDRQRKIRIFNTKRPKKKIWLEAEIWIDGSYEGDLAAAFGCRFRTYREGISEFGEPMAGRIYKLWGKDSLQDGSTGEADSAIQAFNYRLCITKNPENRILFPKPLNYNREEFESLAEDVRTGFVNGFVPKDGKTAAVVNPVKLPNGKYDANNHHRGLISTDLPEENWPYPKADWNWRNQFGVRLRSYTEGLLYFSQNDSSLPYSFRKEALEFGFAKDEYQDNDHFPRQIYVREGRRIEGKSMFTAHDALPEEIGGRPRVHRTSVVSSHYAIDSHAMHKREKGKKTLDGFISYQTSPFTVPFEAMIPIGKEQILCPVPISASHVGFGCLRMEPCWMGLGQAAGVAASLAVKMKCLVSEIPVDSLQLALIRQKANLIYVQDVRQGHPDYEWIQMVAVLGWLPQYEARLDAVCESKDIECWSARSGFSIKEIEELSLNKTRRDALFEIWTKYKYAIQAQH